MIGSAGNSRPESDAVEKHFRKYMRTWDMDSPLMQEIYALRRINNVLTEFWQTYRAAQTSKERRAVINRNWRERLSPEVVCYRKSSVLNWKKRLQLEAIIKRNRPMIFLLERLGGHRIRRQYGK